MATTTGSIEVPHNSEHPAHRRRLALGVTAMLLVGGGVATAAVVARDDSPAPVEHTYASSPRSSSREYSAHLRAQRINVPQLSSREYAALLRAERVAPPR